MFSTTHSFKKCNKISLYEKLLALYILLCSDSMWDKLDNMQDGLQLFF
ncbi:hypothetical protein [Providencia phage PSTCR7]|uniref:Uncharacterized protein n=1 Tax=Providencia phage PSTCR7 TaxID=2783549 RepID=A0A7S9SW55_9CAUD|nr:hypothetical protein PQD10_gp46 [Providencia phage PSTCR7]QPI18498.1 hypothetical protein [Providencia phage PSTCR7]